jgi:predicted TIM-barrel fold metal-dependent hydrolase
MKRICVEEHWGTPEVAEIKAEWLTRTGLSASVNFAETPLVGPRIGDFEKFRLPLMDESGITMQILSSGSPGVQGIIDRDAAVAMAKKINDAEAEIIRKYPGRFAGFACLPTQDPKAAADELERTVTRLGFKRTHFESSVLAFSMLSPKPSSSWATWGSPSLISWVVWTKAMSWPLNPEN